MEGEQAGESEPDEGGTFHGMNVMETGSLDEWRERTESRERTG
jgi:hypothetical protein